MQITDPIFTLFHLDAGQQAAHELETLLANHQQQVARFDSRLTSADQVIYVTQFRTQGHADLAEIETIKSAYTGNSLCDLVVQSSESYHQNYKLACFDMDSTLIQAEVIDELAKMAGVGDEVSVITARAMRGELDFKASFTARMALLKGLPETDLTALAEELPLMTGVKEMMKGLKKRGLQTVILSGGFTFFAEFLQTLLGFDEIHANTLEFANGALTGRAVEPIVDGARKAWLLEQIAQRHDIPLAQTIAVGDGANDLPMLRLAGLGLAFHAKPKVRAEANYSLTLPGLDGVLTLFEEKQ